MRTTKNKFLTDKFAQYQNEQISSSEKKIIDDWFDTKLDGERPEILNDELKTARIQQELFRDIMAPLYLQSTKKHWYTTAWLKVAAGIIIISGTLFFTLQNQDFKNPDSKIAWQTFSTAKGEVKKVTLPDGTEIWMNAGTLIRVPSNFKHAKLRKMQLDHGEAFFHVKRDTLRPFSITTQHFVTTVLGTSFNIKSYPELNTYKVAVATGKVKVDYHNGTEYKSLSKGLVKNQALTYSLNTQQAVVSPQNVNLLSHWKVDRSLYFENMNLFQIGTELSRQYDIDVKVTDTEKSNETYTMHLPHLDILQVLQQIALKTGINYQLTDHTLTINRHK